MKAVVLSFLLYTTLFSQEGVMKTYFSNGNLETEINFKDSVREGEAKFYYENGAIKEERNYRNGKVEGIVKIYGVTAKLKEVFVIENGRREGPTNLFDENGIYQSDTYYEAGKLIVQPVFNDLYADVSEQAADNSVEIKNDAADTKTKVVKTKKVSNEFFLPPEIEEEKMEDDPAFFSTVEILPEPVGGMEAIFKKLIYPSEARKKEVTGIVKVQAFIDEFGEVADAQVIEGIGSGCDDVARNAVYFAKFKPAMQRGKTVRSMVIIPIKFNPEMNQN
jgi:TonB family protein